jgi:hypothetical protein
MYEAIQLHVEGIEDKQPVPVSTSFADKVGRSCLAFQTWIGLAPRLSTQEAFGDRLTRTPRKCFRGE